MKLLEHPEQRDRDRAAEVMSDEAERIDVERNQQVMHCVRLLLDAVAGRWGVRLAESRPVGRDDTGPLRKPRDHAFPGQR